MVIGESRTELLQWLNTTLDLNYTKVEQCGSGAAFCQLMDSVVGDIPMGKVKFEAKTEYDYRHNMKILQAAFSKHGITKVIESERLIKCRLQDNLDLLQWFKRFWMENKSVNDVYDAKSKRKTSGINNTTSRAIGSRTSSGSSTTSRRTTITNNTAQPTNPTSRRVSSTSRSSITPNTPQNSHKVGQLNKELNETMQELANVNEELQEYKISVESLETERNFYFNKLREIEILSQNVKDLIDNGKEEDLNNLTIQDFTMKIQAILYSTEDGFQSTGEDQGPIETESF